MHKYIDYIALSISIVALVFSGFLFFNQGLTLGTAQFVTAEPTKLSGSGVSATDTTINLIELETPSGDSVTMSDFGDIGYGTIEPGRSNKEFISFTGLTQNGDGSASLTGVTRGLQFTSPYTASTSLRKPHPGSSRVVFSDPPQLWDTLVSKLNDGTVTSTITFNTLPVASSTDAPTSNTQFTIKKYVDDTVSAGAPDADFVTKGIVEIASTTQFGNGVEDGDDTSAKLVPSNSFFSSSTRAEITGVVTNASGKIRQAFLDLTEAFQFQSTVEVNGGLTASSTLDVTGTSTFNGNSDFANNIPTIPTSTPTTDDEVASKNYVDDQDIPTLIHEDKTNQTIDFDSTASTTFYSFTLNGGVLGTGNGIMIRVHGLQFNLDSGINATVKVRYGGQDIGSFTESGTANYPQAPLTFYLMADGGTSAQYGEGHYLTVSDGVGSNSVDSINTVVTGSGTVDSTQNQTVEIVVERGSSGPDNVKADGIVVTRLSQ